MEVFGSFLLMFLSLRNFRFTPFEMMQKWMPAWNCFQLMKKMPTAEQVGIPFASCVCT